MAEKICTYKHIFTSMYLLMTQNDSRRKCCRLGGKLTRNALKFSCLLFQEMESKCVWDSSSLNHSPGCLNHCHTVIPGKITTIIWSYQKDKEKKKRDDNDWAPLCQENIVWIGGSSLHVLCQVPCIFLFKIYVDFQFNFKHFKIYLKNISMLTVNLVVTEFIWKLLNHWMFGLCISRSPWG